MKKFFIVLAIVFVANLGCKKIGIDGGGGLCACSPAVDAPYLSLVITSSEGTDLLNKVNAGSINQNEIQLYKKEPDGSIKAISFAIRPPFTAGTEQFDYFQLFSIELAQLAKTAGDTFYLKLKDQATLDLSLQVNSNSKKVEKLFVNGTEAAIEAGPISKYVPSPIFYLIR